MKYKIIFGILIMAVMLTTLATVRADSTDYNNLDIIRRFTLTRGILFLNGQVMTLKSTSIASTAQAGIVGALGTTSIDYSSSGRIMVQADATVSFNFASHNGSSANSKLIDLFIMFN